MAQDTVGTLFNLPTQQQAGQQYLEGMMSSPAQLNQLSLLQQITAMGRDAGSMAGYGAGRLLGGKAPDEIRIQGVNEAMAEATRIGGTDAEMYANLAKGLASRGLTQDAMAATERARTAKRDEQAMTLATSQEARAVDEAKLRASADQRQVEAAARDKQKFEKEMEIFPLTVRDRELSIREREKNVNGVMGELTMAQEALAKGINPQTGKPLTDTEAGAFRASVAQATLQINNEASKLAREREIHELEKKKIAAQIAASNAAAAASRNGSAFKYNATIQVPAMLPTDPPRTMKVGRMNSMGEVIGNDGKPYANVDEAAQAQGFVNAPAASAPAAAAGAPAAEKKAEPDVSLISGFLTNQPQANTQAQSPAFILQYQKEENELLTGKRKAFSPEIQNYIDKTQGTKAQNKANQDAYLRQEQERMLRGNR